MKAVDSNRTGSPSLKEVRRAFERWRATRIVRGDTPLTLRQQSVDLLAHHRPFHVCQALGINATALKQWSASLSALYSSAVAIPTPTFVELPVSPEHPGDATTPNARVLIEFNDGTRAYGNDPVALARLLVAVREQVEGIAEQSR